MVMIDKDSESADIDCEDSGEKLHALDDPGFAMREILMSDWIKAA